MRWYDVRIWKWAIITLLGGIILASLIGCKSKEYVMIPEYHTEYICRTDTFAKVDSVYLKDSVYVYHNGDTVIVNKTMYRDRYHNINKVKMDTIIKTDSVNIPYPCERTLTKKEQRLMALGRGFIAFLFIVLIGMCVIWWYHNKKC